MIFGTNKATNGMLLILC